MKLLRIESREEDRCVVVGIDIEPVLEVLQKQVGGDIQYLPVTDTIDAYINENGKLDKSMQGKINPLATALGHDVIGTHSSDYVGGPMLLVGVDKEGDEASVPPSAIGILNKVAGDNGLEVKYEME